MLFFFLPAFVIYSAGLAMSAWDLVRHPENLQSLPPQAFLGLALTVIGLGICFAAARTLRRSYSPTLVVKDDHRLITHGLYRWIRHPLYLGLLMASMGLPVLVSSLHGLLIMLLLIPVVLNRIRIEERMLIDEYGDEYRAYKQATKKLIPFVY